MSLVTAEIPGKPGHSETAFRRRLVTHFLMRILTSAYLLPNS